MVVGGVVLGAVAGSSFVIPPAFGFKDFDFLAPLLSHDVIL
jgi:hypothetical protein